MGKFNKAKRRQSRIAKQEQRRLDRASLQLSSLALSQQYGWNQMVKVFKVVASYEFQAWFWFADFSVAAAKAESVGKVLTLVLDGILW